MLFTICTPITVSYASFESYISIQNLLSNIKTCRQQLQQKTKMCKAAKLAEGRALHSRVPWRVAEQIRGDAPPVSRSSVLQGAETHHCHATHLGLLPLRADQRVLVVLGHFCQDALQLGGRDLQGLQGLLGISFIQGFINQPDG